MTDENHFTWPTSVLKSIRFFEFNPDILFKNLFLQKRIVLRLI